MTLNKVCGICKKEKPDSTEYFSAYTTSSGNPSRRGTCKACMSERALRHQRERPDLRKATTDRRQERNQNAEGSYSKSDIDLLFKNLKGRCFYCGEIFDNNYTVDHMISLAKGGTNWPSNLTLACKVCNFDKHTKSASEFVKWRMLHSLPCTAGAMKTVKCK
jgi:5-methylcytosine-specific restriction endonuclease McrA